MTVSFLIPKQEGNNVIRTVQKILFLVICLAMAASGTATAAEGSGNIDGGGGNINQGVEGYMWYTGFEGVRLTLVDAETGIQSGLLLILRTVIYPLSQRSFLILGR